MNREQTLEFFEKFFRENKTINLYYADRFGAYLKNGEDLKGMIKSVKSQKLGYKRESDMIKHFKLFHELLFFIDIGVV